MNNTFPLEQTAKAGDPDADLIKRQYKKDKMGNYMDIKSVNPKLKQCEIARDLKVSPSILQRYRRKIKTRSPYRIPNTHARKQKSCNHDHKRTSNDLRMISKDLKKTSKDENDKVVSKKVISKNNLKGGDLKSKGC